jgi:hypothetical protein
MNKKQILLEHAGTPVADLPEAVKRVVESDPALQQTFHDQARCAAMLHLKNYETQDQAMEGRILHRVGVRIRNGEHLRRESTFDALPDWARMVAVVVVMLGLSLMTHREMLENNELEEGPQTAAVIAPVPVSHQSLTDPFGPVYVTFDEQETPNLLTPEFTRSLETSILELGLDLSNRQENVTFLPVSYLPLGGGK